jgi:hypothetical protein
MSPYKEIRLIFKLRWSLYTKEDRELAKEYGMTEGEWTERVIVEMENFSELDNFIPEIKGRLQDAVLRGLPEEMKGCRVSCELVRIDFRATRSIIIDRKTLILDNKGK